MRKIYFVKYNNWPSAILCADQTAEALRAQGYDAWSVSPRDVREVRDAIVVFVKIARWWHVARARRNRNITVFDVQDALIFDKRIKNRGMFDAILWRNRRQFEDYGRPEQANRVLHQHWDPRYTTNRINGERIAIGYFGCPRSFVHWGRVPDVACFETDYFRNALDYNCHLSVRAPGSEHLYKPNCKVSTAAACNANLITTRDASSIEMLGENYPFYIDSWALPDLLAGIEKARASFGGPLWREGLERMREVREKTSIERAIGGYLDFFAEIGG